MHGVLTMTANEPNITNKNSDLLWETVSEVVDQLQYFVDQADDKATSFAELIQKLLEVERLPGINREELSIVYCEYGTQDYKLIVYAGEEIKDDFTPEGTFDSDNQFIKDVAINSMKAEDYPWFKTKTECKDAGFVGFGTVMIIPMRLGRDRRIGAFIIHSKKENAYDKRLQRVLDVLSDRLAALIRSLRRRLRDELTYELRNKLLEQLTSNDEKRMFHSECEILDKVLKHLKQWYEHDHIHILIKNPLDIENYFLATDEQSENIRAGFRSTQVLDEKSLYQIVGGKDNLEAMKAPPSVDVSSKDNQSVASRGAIRNPSKLPNIHEECQSWLGVTMHHPDGYVFGHIVLHDTGMPHAYDNDDLRFMDALADFLGFFLVEFRSKQKKEVMRELASLPIDKPKALSRKAADYLLQFYGIEHFQIWAMNSLSLAWEKAWSSSKQEILPQSMEDNFQNKITVFANKHRVRKGYVHEALKLSLGGKSYLVTPMRAGASEEDWLVIGAFVIPANNPGKIASRVIDDVSDVLGAKLKSRHNQKRYEALTTFVNEVSSLHSTDLTQEKILRIAYQHISKVMFSENMYIALYDGVKDTISFPLIYRKGEIWEEMHNQERKIDSTQLGRTEVIIREKKPLLIKTKEESEAWYKQPNHKEHAGNPLASWVGVPIFAASEGKTQTVRGVIAAYHDDLDYVYSIRDVFFLQNVAGSVSGLFRVLENQDLKEANRKLEEANIEIAEKERQISLSILTRDISHRIKNSLGSVLINIKEIKNSQTESENRLSLINESEVLIKNLIAETAKITVSGMAEINLCELSSKILSQIIIEKRIPKKVKIKETYSENSIIIKASYANISNCLHILIDNAAFAVTNNYSENEEPFIEVSIYRQNSSIVIDINDNGENISESIKSVIFYPGMSSRKQYGGTGYGLWRAMAICKSMHGSLELIDNSNAVKTFRMTLPDNQITKKKLAYVIDDETSWVKIIKRWLEEIGYNVKTANNYEDAISLIKEPENDVSLITLDIALNAIDSYNIDGLKLIDLIKESLKNTKLVVISGLADKAKQYTNQIDFLLEKVSDHGAIDKNVFQSLIKQLEK